MISATLSGILAEHRREQVELAELRRWIDGGRKALLSSGSKARWIGMVAEHDGLFAAMCTMDTLATNHMPGAIQ